MSKLDINKSIVTVEDDATWTKVLEMSDEMLIVMDCHQDWCGPCDAIMPTFQRMFLDYDNAASRIAIATASLQKFGSKIQALIPNDAHITVEKQGCLPLFIMLRMRSVVATIAGVDAPTIIQQIAMNIPENKAKEDDIISAKKELLKLRTAKECSIPPQQQ